MLTITSSVRYVIVIPDGMADRPCQRLNGRTPLQVADADNFNFLAKIGSTGVMDPLNPNVAPGSDVAHLNILGYDPNRFYTGRGPLEAAGCGIELNEEDVAFRCNICELDQDGKIVSENVSISKDEARKLEDTINRELDESFGDAHIIYRQTVGYRGVLIIRGNRVSQAVLTSQPRKNEIALGARPLVHDSGSIRTADLLNEFVMRSEELLADFFSLPNRRFQIRPWGGGKKPQLPSFAQKHGMRAAGIAGVPLIKGVCRLCGISVIDVPGATGGPDTDTLAKACAALGALESNDLVLLHIEATDELSHDGDINGKIEMIRKIDTMMGFLIEKLDLENTRIALLPDHTTSSELRRHTGDPVPVVIAGGGFFVDGSKEYTEDSCKKGSLGRFNGRNFLRILRESILS